MPLFGKNPKSPADVVRTARDNLIALERGEAKKPEKNLDEITKMIGHMKSMACRSVQDQTEPSTEIIAQLAQEMYNQNLIIVLLTNLQRLDFESKKDVVAIFNNILRRQIGTRNPTVEYICTKPELLFILVHGYERPDVALNCGNMLRESIRFEPLAKIVLYSEHFDGFFNFVEGSAFDIASDAFTTFKELLTKHKVVVAEYLDANYNKFFEQYQKLLISENYVTRRQSLKLLGELLLDRHNFNVMTRYISNPDNLKLMMNMLREKSRNIQFEAFHVFKVFVANPNKQKPIVDILVRNRDRLVEFLTKFHTDRQDDEQFNDEKAYLIKQIKDMKASPTAGGNATPAGASAAAVSGIDGGVASVPSLSNNSNSASIAATSSTTNAAATTTPASSASDGALLSSSLLSSSSSARDVMTSSSSNTNGASSSLSNTNTNGQSTR